MKKLIASFTALTISSLAFAQDKAGETTFTMDQTFKNITIFAGLAIFLIIVLRAFIVANVTLRDNGGETSLRFPVIKSFTTHPKAVAAVIILIIACVVACAAL